MKKDVVLVCIILGFLGTVTVTLGFVANFYSSKSVVYDGTKCVYSSPPAIGCDILVLFLVLINQVIVAAYTSDWCRCFCCCCCCPCWTKRRRAAPASKRHKLGIILSLFSWALTIVAVVAFSLGVSESSREEPPVSQTPTSYACKDPEKIGNFPTASLSSLIAIVLGVASYTLLKTAAPETPPHGFIGVEVVGASTGQQSQLQTRPTTCADQEAEHVSLDTAV